MSVLDAIAHINLFKLHNEHPSKDTGNDAIPPKRSDDVSAAEGDAQVTIIEAPSSPSSCSSSSNHWDSQCDGESATRARPAEINDDLVRRSIPVSKLTDEELWEPWFSFPSRPHMTLHRWAEGQKSQLAMHIHHISYPIPPISSANANVSPTSTADRQAIQLEKLLSLSRSTLSSLKVLVIGSILLIRGVQHGSQMGRTLFGRMLGDRYNDLMAFDRDQDRDRHRDNHEDTSESRGSAKLGTTLESGEQVEATWLYCDESKITRAVEEARILQLRGNEFFTMGKYEASLEHYGLGIIRLIPWDCASMPPDLARKTGFIDTDLALILSIALTSIRLTESLPLALRAQDAIPGSRLYRLTMASCDYVRCSPVPLDISQSRSFPLANAKDEENVEVWADEEAELGIVQRLEEIAGRIAGIPLSTLSGQTRDTSPRKMRRSLEEDLMLRQ